MHKVLIADGDKAFQDLLTQALAGMDYQVAVASGGREALRHVAVGAVDVLITEVHLPDMPAWELIEKVHQLDPHVPIIAVTDDDSWETSKKVRVEGGPIFFYGLKPLDLREIQQVVYCAMRWRQGRRGYQPQWA